MRRSHHNNHRDSLPVFSHPYLVPVPLGGFEPPSPPYERGASNHLRYSDIMLLRRAEVLIPIHITANDLFSRQSRRAYPVDSPLVKPSVHQPASPPVFGGADFYKFLTFTHAALYMATTQCQDMV